MELFPSGRGLRLELRSELERGAWELACAAPCGEQLEVEGKEARVAGPSVSPSNAFRITPGRGAARFRIAPGARGARIAGVAAFAGGAALAVGGMALYGYGRLDENDGMELGGTVVLATAGLAVLAALPLLRLGSTRVHDERGRRIASADSPPRF